MFETRIAAGFFYDSHNNNIFKQTLMFKHHKLFFLKEEINAMNKLHFAFICVDLCLKIKKIVCHSHFNIFIFNFLLLLAQGQVASVLEACNT